MSDAMDDAQNAPHPPRPRSGEMPPDVHGALHSHLRVAALADVALRNGAVVRTLATAITEVIDDIEPAAASTLRNALDDSEAQLAAINEHLSRALEDLPEGQAPAPEPDPEEYE